MHDDTRAEPYSVEAARAAAERDGLRDWVADFLASPGSDNAPLGAELRERYRWWVGPVELPLDQLNRLAGPPASPSWSPSATRTGGATTSRT
jgi:hypothetical protein